MITKRLMSAAASLFRSTAARPEVEARLDPVGEPLAQVLAGCLMAADIPVVVVDAVGDLPIVYVNAAFEGLTGYRSHEVLGRNCRFMQGPDTDPAVVRSIGGRVRAGQAARARLLNYRADGSPFWCDLHISAVRDRDGRVRRFIGIQHDATAEVAQLRELTEAADLDPLTGLMNRTGFTAQAERELLRAARHNRAAAVLFLDLDRFKQVNDTHGHTTGDAYLAHVARTLQDHLRAEDTAARHGGDEFTVLLTDLPAGAAAITAARAAVEHLSAALSQPFTLDGVHHQPAVTIGSALFPHDADTVPGLITHADVHLYRNKRPRPPGAPLSATT